MHTRLRKKFGFVFSLACVSVLFSQNVSSQDLLTGLKQIGETVAQPLADLVDKALGGLEEQQKVLQQYAGRLKADQKDKLCRIIGNLERNLDCPLIEPVRPVEPLDPNVAKLTETVKNIQITSDNPYLYGYFPLTSINPGQLRYSDQNTQQKIAKAIKKGNAIDLGDGTYKGAFDDGKSTLDTKDALPVILGPGKVVLVDGHHDTIASRRLNMQTVPVKVVADLSRLPEAEFWEEAVKRNYVYPYTLEKQRIIPLPTDWNALQNDDFRYFAAIAALKCTVKTQTEEGVVTEWNIEGAEFPLWVKIGKDIPFIEFMISDVLRDNNFGYMPGEEDDPTMFQQRIEEARQILKTNPINGLKVVPKKVHRDQINNGKPCTVTLEILNAMNMQAPAEPADID